MAVATQPSMVAQLQNFGQLTNSQKIGLIVAVAAIVALFSGGYLWYQTPTYQILYTNLSDKDGGAVINALGTMNVPFKTEGTSVIKVRIVTIFLLVSAAIQLERFILMIENLLGESMER